MAGPRSFMIDLLAFGFGGQEMIVVLVIVLVLFGGKKIPELLRGVGKGVGELQKGLEEGKRQLHTSIHDEPEPAVVKTDVPATQK